jgi:copper chaperone NosL
MTRLIPVSLALVIVAACARQVEPAPLDAANTPCRHCRMAVSDVHFASQIAAPGAEPIFFDDLGCLRDFLKQNAAGPDAVAFVADHRTGAWVRAADAVFTRPPNLNTPMGGGMIAHADQASRDRDPAAAGAAPVAREEIFGSAGPPNGGGK